MRPYLEAPIKATFSVTDRCPLQCAHCYGECSDREDELSTADWLGVIDDSIASGVIACLIEGGEPLLRTDLFALLEHCRGRLMVWLRTHAVGIDAVTARRIDESGVAAVLVDVFGATAETHDHHAGVDGSFEATLYGIRALVARGLETIPIMILTRRNVGELQQAAELAAGLGCSQLGILRLYPLGRARRAWDALALSRNEMLSALDELRSTPGLRIMQSWHPHNKNCCWEMTAVMADGRYTGCPYLREFVDYGHVNNKTLLESWDNPLHRRLRAGPAGTGHCGVCDEEEGTRGGCRATAFAFTGDWDGQDPFCPSSAPGIDLRVLPA